MGQYCGLTTAHILLGSKLGVVAKMTLCLQIDPLANQSLKSYAKCVTTEVTKS